MKEISLSELAIQAREAIALSKASRSNYKVGAAIACQAGFIFKGANIENRILSQTIHAEQAAAINLLMHHPHNKAIALAVYTPEVEPYFPCAFCRQFLYELFGGELLVVAVGLNGIKDKKTLDELYPYPYPRLN